VQATATNQYNFNLNVTGQLTLAAQEAEDEPPQRTWTRSPKRHNRLILNRPERSRAVQQPAHVKAAWPAADGRMN
jgi:hypothetical protein